MTTTEPSIRVESPGSGNGRHCKVGKGDGHAGSLTPQNASSPLASIADRLGVGLVEDLRSYHASAQFVERIPIHFARQHGLLALASDNGKLPVVFTDPRKWQQLDMLARLFGKPIEPMLAPPEQVEAAINFAYQQRTGQTEQIIDRLDPADATDDLESLTSREDLLDGSNRAPVIKLVNALLFEAVKQESSDLHVQPYEQQVVVRLRIDGVLFDAYTLPKSVQEEVVSRIKVMGRMNIAEKRLAQDGRATVQIGDRIVDLRISSIPTSFGERLVIRLLDKTARLCTLGELGMSDEVLTHFRQLVGTEHGLILVTGPTGSGKSTTLYAALAEINAKEKNVLTLEDPIEYQLPGISQTQINNLKGMTFASGLRHVLRQDPDIIMVGEIRDHETAVMAIQSALTGHLVLSTLHTNDAASAITRLLDLGIEPYLVASSVVGVLAQRLVRRVCANCVTPGSIDVDDLVRLGVDLNNHIDMQSSSGRGCPACRQTGFRGRIGIFEMLAIDEQVRALITERATADRIRNQAVSAGMRSLRDDGMQKINTGITTVDEVLRVTARLSV